VPSGPTATPRGFTRPLATVGQTAPDAPGLADAPLLLVASALPDGAVLGAAADALGRGAIDALDGLVVWDGAAQAAATSAPQASVTSPTRAPMVKRDGLRDMSNSYKVCSTVSPLA
jgi:hypothetical protein